jgi:hypothetical protein
MTMTPLVYSMTMPIEDNTQNVRHLLVFTCEEFSHKYLYALHDIMGIQMKLCSTYSQRLQHLHRVSVQYLPRLRFPPNEAT